MKRLIDIFKKAFAAGIMIGIGGTIFVASDNRIIGAVLFSVGLLSICFFGMNLYTGKIGYIIGDKDKLFYLFVWLGNLAGTVFTGALVRIAKPAYAEAAAKMLDAKFSMGFFQVLILSFFCGILMYIAVHNHREHPHSVSGVVGIFMCVTVFILAGFEHSIADMAYCAIGIRSAAELPKALLFILEVTLGNSLGAIAVRKLTN
ncbi:MAG: formate/nitrite transporter family protein [Oscillospiraceae bacterium]|nr:formate/nitrite transporter family protein [Oscillospiraceae bacterium]